MCLSLCFVCAAKCSSRQVCIPEGTDLTFDPTAASHSTLLHKNRTHPHIRPYPTKNTQPFQQKTTLPGSHLTLPHFSRFTFDPNPHEAKLKPVQIRPYLKPAIREPTLEQLHSLVSNQPAPLGTIIFIAIKSTSPP